MRRWPESMGGPNTGGAHGGGHREAPCAVRTRGGKGNRGRRRRLRRTPGRRRDERRRRAVRARALRSPVGLVLVSAVVRTDVFTPAREPRSRDPRRRKLARPPAGGCCGGCRRVGYGRLAARTLRATP